MSGNVLRTTLLALGLSLAVPLAWTAETDRAAKLRVEVEALKAPEVAWRKIPWRTDLIAGLNEARTENKPLLLWVFIDRPIDDARC